MTLLLTILAFLLALGPLIVFHELGHYTVARLCGVKVLRFSVGMGKVVWSRRFGRDQTEWAISALPLGGYVKMLDSRELDTPLSEHELKREFNHQSVWRRIAIVAAGPIANFILAIGIFAGLYMHGVEEPAARLRAAAESTAAWQAGVRAGDRVVAVNDTPVGAWSELRWEVIQAIVDKAPAKIELERLDGGRDLVTLPAATLAGLDMESDVLGVLGFELARPPARLEEIVPGGPAEHAGLRPGDLIEAVNGRQVADGIDLIEAVRASEGRSLSFAGERAGQPFVLEVTPKYDAAAKTWLINARPDLMPEMETITAGPISAVAKGAGRTWDTGVMILKMVKRMITGEASLKNISGPITIADYAGQSARIGPEAFLLFIAAISISLGVMNLLPIPVLDGGLLLYYSLEVLTGRPLPERVAEYAQRAGIGLLLMLMMLAVFNDIARLML